MWLSVGQALGNGVPLTLPLDDLGLDGPLVRPDEILREIPIVPWLYHIDGYGALLKTFQEAGLTVVSMDYDWRDDLMRAVRHLDETVVNLKRRGIDRIALVAHSMGGLIASYYLRYGAQEIQTATETWKGANEVRTVVLAGVPFDGSMATFRNMIYGRPIGLNDTLLNFEAVSSFPASYYVLPRADSDRLLTPNGTERQGLIGDASNWARYQWGLLRDKDGLAPDVGNKRLAYTVRWLEIAGRFHDLVNRPSTHDRAAGCSLMSIVGIGTSTLAKGRLNDHATGRSSVRFDDGVSSRQAGVQENSVFEDGDGTVTRRASVPPDAYAKRLALNGRTYEATHIDLMNRKDIRRDILNFVVEGLALTPASER
ncbi:conserved protein of unknown function [Nitrospira japonica]|uniref:Lecithin:cholesterol acyltransferase n=2 Tax=Nitrospira japonica TaxID=1325564 RepID=A0A1W1I4A8_9BACT|nr:conserved protein of unknown function [Nitrospira japonica]